MSERHALYPGTFDPVTLGHLDVLARARRLFDRVTVLVAARSKSGLLDTAERVALFRAVTPDDEGVQVESFAGLLVDEVMGRGAVAVVRGIRSTVDYENEWNLFGGNSRLSPGVEHVFFMARPELACISSSLVRDVALHGGDLSAFVAPPVAAALARRFGKGR